MLELALLLLFALLLVAISKAKANKYDLTEDLRRLKIHTVNALNKVLKIDTTRFLDFHIPEVHCDGLVSKILSPEELVKISVDNPPLFQKLAACGYTRVVGLVHAFVLWPSLSKSKDLASFKRFVEYAEKLDWQNPKVFVDFHSKSSVVGSKMIFEIEDTLK